MDEPVSPGYFILQAAELGLRTAAAVLGFAPSYKAKKLASKLSLSATLLSEVGKEVNRNEGCFKNNFQQTFEHVAVRCEKEYNTVSNALDRATSRRKDDVVRAEESPKKPWKRLMFELGMNDNQFEEFEETLDESWARALMIQHVVSLIVLQVRAQKQDLTVSELNNLGRLKKQMGQLLEAIRAAEVASVVAFGLADLTKAANAAQIIEAAEDAAPESSVSDDASSISTSVTILDTPLDDTASVKKEPELKASEERPVVVPVARERLPEHEDIYEMYRASTNVHAKKGNQMVYRFLGIPLKVDTTQNEVIAHMDRIPSSIPEIKAFIEKEKDDENTQPASLTSLVNVSPTTSTAIYTLINNKNEERTFPRRIWNTELLVPYEWWESKRLGRKMKKTDGYIVVLRGEVTYHPFNFPGLPGPPPQRHFQPGPPPPPRNWPTGGPPVIVNIAREAARSRSRKNLRCRKERKTAAQIELTEEETERVLNDFLATFSTLYDGIPVEERGAALKAIDWEDDGEFEYDSDHSLGWSSSSRSLVDD